MSTLVGALKGRADQILGKREQILSLWQDIAENFYPERADFTVVRNVGDELALNLMTSAPVLARRDLGNAFGGMLRPTAKEWFHLGTTRPEETDTEAKQWLEYFAKFQRRVMYDRRAQFSRATKEADHDYAAFGQAAVSIELNKAGDGILYRCWHLRDVGWRENEEGKVATVARKWKPTAADLRALFKDKVHRKVQEAMEKDPYKEFNCIHLVLPADEYQDLPGARKVNTPFVSIYLDCDNQHIMEDVGSWWQPYVIPRWQTVSGSQYAYSPATVVGLADSRLLQSMTRVILSAGEKGVDPPMLGVQEAIRGDIALYAGGVTWVDAEYDERLGEVLRPITQDRSALGFGLDMVQDLRAQLAEAFFISKINLPPQGGPDMTAYEVGQRVQEFIRNALPLFEPMEMDYNGQICETTFEILLRMVPELRNQMPRSLAGADVQFSFESPLRDAIEKMKVGQFMEAQQVLAATMQMDPSTAHLVNTRKATREVLEAVAPASWLRSEMDVEMLVRAQEQQVQQAQQAAAMQQGAQTAKTLAEAGAAVGVDAEQAGLF